MTARYIASMAVAAVMCLLCACSRSEGFEITGEIEGLGTQNIYLVYHDGSGLKTETVTAVDSKFKFAGNVARPTAMEVYSTNRTLLGRFVVDSNDRLKVTLRASDPLYLSAKGNACSEALASWLDRADHDNLNEEIARQVAREPSSALTAMLMTYYYDIAASPTQADSLMQLVNFGASPTPLYEAARTQAARAARAVAMPVDSLLLRTHHGALTHLCTDSVATIIWLSTEYTINDSIARRLADEALQRINLAYIRLTPDSAGWGKADEKLPERIISVWEPGGPASPALAPLDIPAPEYFIVVDSTHTQIYRGTDFDSAFSAATAVTEFQR